jgi:hypothetical protein
MHMASQIFHVARHVNQISFVNILCHIQRKEPYYNFLDQLKY